MTHKIEGYTITTISLIPFGGDYHQARVANHGLFHSLGDAEKYLPNMPKNGYERIEIVPYPSQYELINGDYVKKENEMLVKINHQDIPDLPNLHVQKLRERKYDGV